MGISGSKSKSTQTASTQARATTTPTVPDYIQSPVTGYYGQLGQLLSGNAPQTVGASPLQQTAFSRAQGMAPNAASGQGLDALRALLAQGGVQAGQVASTDLSPYMNPYTQQVIDAGLGDIERFRGMGINQGASNATRSGAFGGSRHGVADSLTNEAALREAGSFAGQQRQAGFNTALQTALADIANRLGADQFNVSSRSALANNLVQGGLGADASQRADIGAQAALGEQERGITQETDPAMARARWLANLQALLGVQGGDLIGQNVNSSGNSTGTTTTKSGGSLLDGLGQLLQIGGAFGLPFPKG